MSSKLTKKSKTTKITDLDKSDSATDVLEFIADVLNEIEIPIVPRNSFEHSIMLSKSAIKSHASYAEDDIEFYEYIKNYVLVFIRSVTNFHQNMLKRNMRTALVPRYEKDFLNIRLDTTIKNDKKADIDLIGRYKEYLSSKPATTRASQETPTRARQATTRARQATTRASQETPTRASQETPTRARQATTRARQETPTTRARQETTTTRARQATTRARQVDVERYSDLFRKKQKKTESESKVEEGENKSKELEPEDKEKINETKNSTEVTAN